MHEGGCHCGNIRARLLPSRPPAETPLRACACAFCRAHQTRTVADPNGAFELWAEDWDQVERYRFGSCTADYMVCRRCGVYVAAICETAAGTRAVVNINSFADRAAFTRQPAVSDYDGETPEARLSRRAEKWMLARVHIGPP